MTTQTETGHAGGFILSIANRTRSIDNISVASGESMASGEVYALVGSYAVPFDPADSSGGADQVGGILYDAVDASAAATPGAGVARDAEVNANELVWPTGISTGDKSDAVAALAGLGIIVR